MNYSPIEKILALFLDEENIRKSVSDRNNPCGIPRGILKSS